jgi:hypothetical protein
MAKKKTKRSFKATLRSWKIGDYVRQLSVVVIGILITFQGSALVTKNAQRREVANILGMVKYEIEKNRRNVELQKELLEFEYAGARALKPYIHDTEGAPADTLAKYVSIIVQVRNYGFSTNSFEVLKSSSNFQTVKNKELLRDLFSTYESLGSFFGDISSYNSLRSSRMQEQLKGTDSEVFDVFYSNAEDVAQMIFSHTMKDPAMRNYIISIANGNNVNYLIPNAETLIEEASSVIAEIDREIGGKKSKK